MERVILNVEKTKNGSEMKWSNLERFCKLGGKIMERDKNGPEIK